MAQRRKISQAQAGGARGARGGESAGAVAGEVGRPLTARSVVASTLLGVEPPRLPTRLLVRSGELFGISQGTTRVALSRMVAAGELVVDGNAHGLAGRLLERQARQQASRVPRRRGWTGEWIMAVVTETRRPVAARAELRAAMGVLRLAEWREGVWLRPDNLDESWADGARAVLATQCGRFVGRPDPADGSDVELVGRLWDLDTWDARARGLRRRLAQVVGSLEEGDTAALAPGFVLSAEVLRHLLADPLLPPDLLGPDWSGDALRTDYDRYDRAFKTLWRDWFRREADH